MADFFAEEDLAATGLGLGTFSAAAATAAEVVMCPCWGVPRLWAASGVLLCSVAGEVATAAGFDFLSTLTAQRCVLAGTGTCTAVGAAAGMLSLRSAFSDLGTGLSPHEYIFGANE